MITMDTIPACPAGPNHGDRSLLAADLEPSALGAMLPILWAFIGSVCAYDVYLSIKYAWCLCRMERNPIGTWLLHLDGGNPALFMTVKFFSSLVVVSVLIILQRRHVRLCWILTASISFFQLCLAAFLTLA